MRPIPSRLLAATLLLLPAAAHAQGTLSTQGFGYPSGQLSTRALGTGGAVAEIDPLSVSNPSTLVNFGGSALYIQAEPEYRTITAGGTSQRNTIARYPLVLAAVPLTHSLFAGVSATNLLDRTFQTKTRSSVVVGGTPIASTNTFGSDGAIGDLRLALAWAPTSWIHLGVGAHAITGDNRLTNAQVFDDSTIFAPLVDSTTVTYAGSAYSAGLELIAARQAVFAMSYRRGGNMSLKHGDTTLTNARVPDRLSFSLAYIGITGSAIAVRTSRDKWSNMAGLGSAGLPITDGWDSSVGADILGPRFAGRALQLRAGARRRTLPFGIGTSDVKETSYSFGAGTTMARGRAALDVTGIHATRDATGVDVQESAWTLSVGITVRP